MQATINKSLNAMHWFQKHLLEVLVAATLSFMIWEATQILEIREWMSAMNVHISHIDEAVNNAGKDEKTLRELVVETADRLKDVEWAVRINHPSDK